MSGYASAGGFAMPCAPARAKVWCGTCGKDAAAVDAQGDCPGCAKWWAENPPPAAPETPGAGLFPEASGAVFSPCQRYRYTLRRDWDMTAWPLTFLMLNPSTADATLDDPTIRRCIRFARDRGFGGLRVLNIFAFRATDPADMKREADPVGPDNDFHIREAFQAAARAGVDVIAAWGVHGVHNGREAAVRALAAECGVTLMCLGTTDKGHPRHPLYVPAAQPFVRL